MNDDGGGDGGALGGMGGIQMMGIMNALKTGDVRMDMLIAMCIPIILRLAFDFVSRLSLMWSWEDWMRWYIRPQNEYERFIAYKSTRGDGGTTNLDSDTQNTVLVKAIQLYMHHELDLHFLSANLDLTSMEDKSASLGYYDYNDDCSDDGSGERKTLVGVLSKYKVVKKPPEDVWHELGTYGGKDDSDGKQQAGGSVCESAASVRLCIRRQDENVGSGNDARQYSTLTLHFVSPSETAIDDFVDTAFKWYMDQLRSMEDYARYLYELKSVSSKSYYDDYGGNDSNGMVYTRFKLSDEKTFDSLFFPQKETLLSLIAHFTNKTGKYAIPGYPHKLGLLLHGPPGTGKTSLIKALAQATGRSIVNVPLARISTNSELMSVFFDKKYRIEGEYVPVKLGFKDIIFVMEDVDAASAIVKRRDGKTTAEMVQTEEIEMPRPKSMWQMLLESSDSDCRELVTLLMSKSKRLKEEATRPEVLKSIAQRMTILPGLGLVGSKSNDSNSPDTDKALQRVGEKALEEARDIMDHYSTVDRFVGYHASAIKYLLEASFAWNDKDGENVDKEAKDGADDETEGAKDGKEEKDSEDGKEEKDSEDGKEEKDAEVDEQGAKRGSEVGEVDEELDEEFVNCLLGLSFENDGFKSFPLSRDVSVTLNAGGLDEHVFASTNQTTHMEQILESKFDKDKPENKKGVAAWGALPDKIDKLNLTGLLNVLDGVVDTPGRILIMTTNHPEMLDPALIRPGRIDKRIMLGYMDGADVVSMLEHYFQTTLTDGQRRRVEIAISGDGFGQPQVRMTPAQVEQLTAEHDELEDMIQALEAKSRPVGIKSSNARATSTSTITYNV